MSSLHVNSRGCKTAWCSHRVIFFIMAACTRQPTRPVSVPSARPKGKKRRGDEPLEDKTEALEEGELAACF